MEAMTAKPLNYIKQVNKVTTKQRLSSYKRTPLSLLLYLLVLISTVFTAGILIYLIGYILVHGVPYLTKDLFSLKYTSTNVSLFPAMVNTVSMTALALLFAVPLGIFSAVYLVEYAKKGNRLVGIVRITAETLSGIPSIVYGLFGMLFFVTTLKWGLSILSGAATLAIMILPAVMRTSEEALKSVPDSFREGSFGLGAGKLRTVFQIVLPSALMYTAGTVAEIPSNVMGSGRTLSVHMYALSSEGLHINQSYATAVVLLVVVIIINAVSTFIAKRITKG